MFGPQRSSKYIKSHYGLEQHADEKMITKFPKEVNLKKLNFTQKNPCKRLPSSFHERLLLYSVQTCVYKHTSACMHIRRHAQWNQCGILPETSGWILPTWPHITPRANLNSIGLSYRIHLSYSAPKHLWQNLRIPSASPTDLPMQHDCTEFINFINTWFVLL